MLPALQVPMKTKNKRNRSVTDELTVLTLHSLHIVCEWVSLDPLPCECMAWLAMLAQFCTTTEANRVQPAFVVAR